MAMEAIGSVMSLQAQSMAAPKQTVVEKPETASGVVQQVERVDKTTAVVENSQGKGQTGSAASQGQEQSNMEQIRKALEKLNKSMDHAEAVYGIHEGTNRVMIKIIDKDTKEVIRELPPEKTLNMIAKVWELAGLLVDEKR